MNKLLKQLSFNHRSSDLFVKDVDQKYVRFVQISGLNNPITIERYLRYTLSCVMADM